MIDHVNFREETETLGRAVGELEPVHWSCTTGYILPSTVQDVSGSTTSMYKLKFKNDPAYNMNLNPDQEQNYIYRDPWHGK